MIVLVSGSMRARDCAEAIERNTHQTTKTASSLAEAGRYLDEQTCQAIVIDESWQQVDGDIDSLVFSRGGTAMPIYVNLSLHATERVAREVSCGLQRLSRERVTAMRAAANELRNDLRGEVTAILLNTELAMREPSLAASASEKLRLVYETAERMRTKLDGLSEGSETRKSKPRVGRREILAHSNN